MSNQITNRAYDVLTYDFRRNNFPMKHGCRKGRFYKNNIDPRRAESGRGKTVTTLSISYLGIQTY